MIDRLRADYEDLRIRFRKDVKNLEALIASGEREETNRLYFLKGQLAQVESLLGWIDREKEGKGVRKL